jgi:hypothetical protein
MNTILKMQLQVLAWPFIGVFALGLIAGLLLSVFLHKP